VEYVLNGQSNKMILTIKNINASGNIGPYLNGAIPAISPGNSVVLPRELNTIIAQDALFISQCNSELATINNGSTDMTGPAVIELIKTFFQFATDPLAGIYLYYSVPIFIIQSETTSIGSTVFSIRNPVGYPMSIVIEKINVQTFFNSAQPLVLTNPAYEFVRFSGATPSGGNVITPIKATTVSQASNALTRYADTGLDVSGCVFETPFSYVPCLTTIGATAQYIRDRQVIKLGAGEGLALRISNANAIVGQGICGEIIWSLR
jgi:hypothetical protein